ncbi:hypothetical protein PHEL49_0236 [Polaribacter sp. Hel1_33_49]|nr:hypothetical protein PHEL49_0236 [Polaribacter sp. Hel1_33_49]
MYKFSEKGLEVIKTRFKFMADVLCNFKLGDFFKRKSIY